MALCSVPADSGSRMFQDLAGLGCSRLCGAHGVNLATVPTPGQSVLLMSCSFQLGPSLGRAGAGWGEESRVDGGVAVVPTPLALPSLLWHQLPGVPASRAHTRRSSRAARGRGEPHPRRRLGFPDSPGGREVVQACVLTSPAQGRGGSSRTDHFTFSPQVTEQVNTVTSATWASRFLVRH